jgi:hypothetical protein
MGGALKWKFFYKKATVIASLDKSFCGESKERKMKRDRKKKKKKRKEWQKGMALREALCPSGSRKKNEVSVHSSFDAVYHRQHPGSRLLSGRIMSMGTFAEADSGI